MIRFTIPVKTPNPGNGDQGFFSRGAAMARVSLRKKQRAAAHAAALAATWTPVPEAKAWRLSVTLKRHSAGKLDDDGLRAALKSIRDGIADAIGVDDGSSAVVWSYAQAKSKRGTTFVEVEIT